MEKEIKKFKKEWAYNEEDALVPICACGREMKPTYDKIAKKVTGYLWTCECTPGLILSIG